MVLIIIYIIDQGLTFIWGNGAFWFNHPIQFCQFNFLSKSGGLSSKWKPPCRIIAKCDKERKEKKKRKKRKKKKKKERRAKGSSIRNNKKSSLISRLSGSLLYWSAKGEEIYGVIVQKKSVHPNVILNRHSWVSLRISICQQMDCNSISIIGHPISKPLLCCCFTFDVDFFSFFFAPFLVFLIMLACRHCVSYFLQPIICLMLTPTCFTSGPRAAAHYLMFISIVLFTNLDSVLLSNSWVLVGMDNFVFLWYLPIPFQIWYSWLLLGLVNINTLVVDLRLLVGLFLTKNEGNLEMRWSSWS